MQMKEKKKCECYVCKDNKQNLVHTEGFQKGRKNDEKIFSLNMKRKASGPTIDEQIHGKI